MGRFKSMEELYGGRAILFQVIREVDSFLFTTGKALVALSLNEYRIGYMSFDHTSHDDSWKVAFWNTLTKRAEIPSYLHNFAFIFDSIVWLPT